MGQYYVVVNLDKRQYLCAHKFGDGIKLLEFGCGGHTMTALAVLLADGNGRGGGDLFSEHPIVGSWAGDRIVVAGDYADGGRFVENVPRDRLQEIAKDVYSEGNQQADRVTLYAYAQEEFEDVSGQVIEALLDDCYIRDEITPNLERWAGFASDKEHYTRLVELAKSKGYTPKPAEDIHAVG